MEFAEQLMVDLINQGYRGNDLHEHFKKEVNQALQAMREVLKEAAMVAASKSGYASYGDVFDKLDASQGLLAALAEGEESAEERGWITAEEVEVG